MQPEVMKLMLCFIYGCLDEVPPERCLLLFAASARYGLSRLREACTSVMLQVRSESESEFPGRRQVMWFRIRLK